MGSRVPISEEVAYQEELKRKLELSVAEIGLPVRTTNCLEDRGIFTVAQLVASRPEDLLKIANFGEKTLEEVYLALERLGFFRRSRLTRMGVRGRPTPFAPELKKEDDEPVILQFRVTTDEE
ncbi:DNA-directed RNA polymerase subunit alpha C-terminal domain-containing protein [Thermopirellula anaerolimosa]